MLSLKLMKKIILLFSFLNAVQISAQSELFVYKTGDRTPISSATVSCNGQNIGVTGADGKIRFRTKCKKVDIKAAGYYEDEAIVDKVMEIGLSKTDPKTQNIETVIISDKSDPLALAILKKVNENYAENAPQSLDSYSFKSYEKISLDLDEDSVRLYNRQLNRRIDSLQQNAETIFQDEKEKKDSLETLQVMKLMGESKLFLWERASEFLYSKQFGEKVTILDNRVSGLQNPVYEMMALRSNRTKMPREIREENRSLYRFFLTDSIEIEGRKNYVIRFRQVDYKQRIQNRKYNGYLYVDAENYALKKIESNSQKKSDGSITSIWKPVDNKWFLLQENFKVRMGYTNLSDPNKDKENGDKSENQSQKKFGNYVFMRADYFDFQTNTKQEKKDFTGYTMDVENSDGSLLNQYRTEPLTAREMNSYTKIDSVGKKYELDQKLNFFTGAIRGKVRAGMVDFDVTQIFKYNRYEKVRLGVGAKLNEKFHPYISPDAYVAYGFGDGAWKFGVGSDFHTTRKKTSFFRAEYYNDVMSAGRFNENMWNFRMKIMNSGIDLNNGKFYQYSGFKGSYETDLSNALSMNISAKRNREEAKFDYGFKDLGAEFNNFSTQLTLKYSPKSKNIMTPSGKFTYEQNFPEFYFNYEQALKALGGDFSYSRFDFLVQHVMKSKAGVTGIRGYTGLLLGETPVWHHFAMNGLGKSSGGLNFNFTSYLGFATMEAGKYYNDKFVGFYLTHRIPWYFRTFGKTTSSIDLVYKGIIGDMKNPEFHHFEFQKLDRLYQETGLEINHIFGTPLNLGFFYRVGHYATPHFKENFALQLKFNFLGF